jgi:hypothetical protein
MTWTGRYASSISGILRGEIRFLSLFAVVLLLALSSWTAAYGQIMPSGDAYTNTVTPTTNLGTKPLLDVESASQTTYIQFDLSSIPSGYTSASIAKATLMLYVNAVTTAGSFNVDYVNGTWSEKSITADLAPALGTTIVSSVPLAGANVHDYILIDLTPAVDAWLDGTEPNDGIALVGNSPLNSSFDSKENTANSHPPELDIVFTAGGTISGVNTASGSGLTGGGTSGTLNLSLTNSCVANQVLQWNGSSWACAAVGTGTITGVAGGPGLLGGGFTGNVMLSLDTTKVPLLGANTFAATQTITGGNLALDQTTGANDGVVTIGVQPFIHTCCASTGATDNLFIGSGAGNFGLVGNATSNTALGSRTLTSNTSGFGNTAIGLQALFSNTAGAQNVAVGIGALSTNTSGGVNTAVGLSALSNSTTGNTNTAIGGNALQVNTTGGNNTALGFKAGVTGSSGNANTTGSNNTFLGYQSGPGTTTQLTNATALGANALVSENNALVLGGTGANAVNVGIGTAAPVATLDVRGTGNFTGLINFAAGQTFPGAVGSVTAGTDLTSTGTSTNPVLNLDTTKVPLLAASNTFTGNQTVNGNLSASGVVSGNSFQIGSSLFAFGNVTNASAFLGFAGNMTMTGIGNTATGYHALGAGTSAESDTATGYEALGGNTTGFDNTAAGYLALSTNTTGADNTADGMDALLFNTTGNGNVASGASALINNTTGSDNTGTGVEALGDNSTGENNVATGWFALISNTTGNYNVGDGYFAGSLADHSMITGTFNTFLGAMSSASTGTLTNATAIGANAEVAANNSLVLGSINGVNGASASTNVGVGTTAPTYLLHLGNQGGTSSNNFLRVEGPSQASTGGLAASFGGYGAFAIDAVGTAGGRFVVTEIGRVGIGAASPLVTHSLTIGQGTGHAISDGWDTYSSRRWKTNIQTLKGALARVQRLRGVSYELKGSGKHEVGVIAEEVGAVVPEVVSYEENGKDARGVDYSRLTALLIEATKEQQQELAKALRQIRQQQSLIRAQSGAMRSLKAEVRETRETLRKVNVQVAAGRAAVIAAK